MYYSPIVHIEPKLNISRCTLVPEQYFELLNEHLSIVGVHAAELLKQVRGDIITTSTSAVSSSPTISTSGVLKITEIDVHCEIDGAEKKDAWLEALEDDLTERSPL